MIDLLEYLEATKTSFMIDDPDFHMNISKFFVSNSWFGMVPRNENGKLWVDDVYISKINDLVLEYCCLYNADTQEKITHLTNKLRDELPKTANVLEDYIKATNPDKNTVYLLVDFLLYNLCGELDESTDTEVGKLMETAFDHLPKSCSDIFVSFVNWTREHRKTIYRRVYEMEKYSSNADATAAYAPDEYLQILYHLFNAEYIADNNMYAKAAESKGYVDTWLFLSMHFLCALRNTDLIRIPHPRLKAEPDQVLDQIAQGTFTDADAQSVLLSVVWHLNAIQLTPNKTQGTTGVASIKLHFPVSVEVHMGTLFAAAEAHFLKSGKSSSEPLLRVITDYAQINRYMGEEIGELFLRANFHTRAANKSYLQMISLLTDDVLEVDDEFHVKGYMLAACARSHKGSYGEFAKTTNIYLKDAKMNGFTAGFVAKEMFERGVLSAIPSMLLKLLTRGEYDNLSVENQTKIIKELNMSPAAVERSVALMQDNVRQSVNDANEIFQLKAQAKIDCVTNIAQQNSEREILAILHRIGNGEAVSKQGTCMCLFTAMGKVCPFPSNQNCPSCIYEISTKTTMFIMATEYKRLSKIYKESQNQVERERSKSLAENIVIPSMAEMLNEFKTIYGQDALAALEQVIKEVA